MTEIQQALLHELCKSEDPALQKELLAGKVPRWVDLDFRICWVGTLVGSDVSVLYPKQYQNYYEWAASEGRNFNWYYLCDTQDQFISVHNRSKLPVIKYPEAIQTIRSLLSEGFSISPIVYS